MVPSVPIAGAALSAGRIVPHGSLGGTAVAAGGHGRSLVENTSRHASAGSGAGSLPAAVAAVGVGQLAPGGEVFRAPLPRPPSAKSRLWQTSPPPPLTAAHA